MSEYSINNTINHPNSDGNNIGLIKLANKVKFNPFVRPACLPTSSEPEPSYHNVPHWRAYKDNFFLAKDSIRVEQRKECEGKSNICGEPCENRENVLGIGSPLEKGHKEFYMMVSIVGVQGDLNCMSFKNVYPALDWIEGIVWSGEK